MPNRFQQATGFSLLEVLVAIALLGGAMTALAQLVSIAEYANAGARRTTIATVLAAGKMEELRGAGIDASRDSGGSLESDVGRYCDFFDAAGRLIGVGVPRPEGASFVRRWSIASLGADPAGTRVLQVVVLGATAARSSGASWPAVRREAVELVSVRTRKER